MALCKVCSKELEEGYAYCHFCGTSIQADAASTLAAPKRSLVELAETAETLLNRLREAAGAPLGHLNRWLGSPVSIQRQLLYALISGFVFASSTPRSRGLVSLLTNWLVGSILLFWPIRYWTTGVMPASRVLYLILGGELSLRRRLIFSLVFTVLPIMLTAYSAKTLGPEITAIQAEFSGYPLLMFIGGYLQAFYLMGFTSSWRPIVPSGFSISLERMAGRASVVADRIVESMSKHGIPGLQVTRVGLAKLQGSTWIPPGTVGDQLSLTHGKARVLVFVQEFGEGLFLRTTSFYDASGRRQWLLIGLFVSFLDRLSLRWFGSSFLLASRQFSEVLSPAAKQQVLLRWTTGGLIARTLRLVEGVSEYSWNEVYALEGTIQASVAEILQAAVGSQEEAERVRAQIERQLDSERRFSSGRRSGR